MKEWAIGYALLSFLKEASVPGDNPSAEGIHTSGAAPVDIDADAISTAERGYLYTLFTLSFVSILYLTSITQEIAASAHSLRPRFQIVFGLVNILYGAGMYLAYRCLSPARFSRTLQVLVGATGISMLCSLGLCLMANQELPSSVWLLPLTFLLVGVTLILFGMAYSFILVHFHAHRRTQIGVVVSVGVAAMVCAFAARTWLVESVGNNAVLLAAALCCILFPLGRIGCILSGAVWLLCLLQPVDNQIERFRNIEHCFEKHSYTEFVSAEDARRFQLLWSGWSPFAKINLYRVGTSRTIAAAYNYYITWVFTGKADEGRSHLYSFIRDSDRVLCLAVGGGWPLLAIPEAALAHTTGVEMDPVIVSYFKTHPQHNLGLFQKVDIRCAEGRNALDELDGPFDAILIDLPGSPVTQRETPVDFDTYILTREAIDRALHLLRPDGIFVAYVLPHQVGSTCATMRNLGLAFRVLRVQGPRSAWGYRLRTDDKFAVYTGRDTTRLGQVVKQVLRSAQRAHHPVRAVLPDENEPDRFPPNTDDRPYSHLLAFLNDPYHIGFGDFGKTFTVTVAACKIAFIVISLALAAIILTGSGEERPDLLYFLAIGIGFVFYQLYVYATLRSYLGDPIRTTLYMSMLIFSFASVGSLLTERLHRLVCRPLAASLTVAGIAMGTRIMLTMLPYHWSDEAIKFGVAALVTAPFGVVTGVFFPLGLRRLPPNTLGRALFVDAAGTVLGIVLFYFSSLYVGISRCFWIVLGCYTLATALVVRKRP